MEHLVDFFINNLGGVLSKEAIVFIISMTPILELRGGLLAASLLGIPITKAIPICIVGNIIPIPFILFSPSQGALYDENHRLAGDQSHEQER